MISQKTKDIRNLIACFIYENAAASMQSPTFDSKALLYYTIFLQVLISALEKEHSERTNFTRNLRNFLAHPEKPMPTLVYHINRHPQLNELRMQGVRRFFRIKPSKSITPEWFYLQYYDGKMLFDTSIFYAERAMTHYISLDNKLFDSHALHLKQQARQYRNGLMHWDISKLYDNNLSTLVGRMYPQFFVIANRLISGNSYAHLVETFSDIFDASIERSMEQYYREKKHYIHAAKQLYLAMYYEDNFYCDGYEASRQIRRFVAGTTKGKGFSKKSQHPFVRKLDSLPPEKFDGMQVLRDLYAQQPDAERWTNAFLPRQKLEVTLLEAIVPPKIKNHPDFAQLKRTLLLPIEQRLFH